jgi:hypothetical protein
VIDLGEKRIDLIKGAVSNFVEGIKNLNVEAKDWNVKVGGTPEGTTVDVTIKLFIPKQKK